MKVRIYIPFPELTEHNFEEYCSKLKNPSGSHDSSLCPTTGLPLEYGRGGTHKTWASYEKHRNELGSWREILEKKINADLKRCLKSYKFSNVQYPQEKYEKLFQEEKINADLGHSLKPYEVSNVQYPKKKDEKLFQDLTSEDIIYIHAHGNTSVVGAGPFVLSAGVLVKHLVALGLSSNCPPAIVIWACHSGSSERGISKPYANNVFEALKALGCNRPMVFGMDAEIVNDEMLEKISFVNDGESHGEISESQALVPCVTASTGKGFKNTRSNTVISTVLKMQVNRKELEKIELPKIEWLDSGNKENAAMDCPAKRKRRKADAAFFAHTQVSDDESDKEIADNLTGTHVSCRHLRSD